MTCCKLILTALLLLATTPIFALADDSPLPDVFDVSIKCYQGERVVMETHVQMLGGGYSATIENSQPRTGEHGEALQRPRTVIQIDSTGPLATAPNVTQQNSPAVLAAMEQASLVRLGPLNFWIYNCGADRYEIELKKEVINAAQWHPKAGAPLGWERNAGTREGEFELIGTLRGSLPAVTELDYFPVEKEIVVPALVEP